MLLHAAACRTCPLVPSCPAKRENLFEQIFCAELLQGCWLAGLQAVEIDRPFVDFQGYDLVATCGQVTRHIQLKGTRGRNVVHRALAEKPSACVVNLEVERDEPRIQFRYRYFGRAPGDCMSLESFRAARKAFNTRDASSGGSSRGPLEPR